MKPTLEQIQDELKLAKRSNHLGALDIIIYALELAEQVVKGEVVVMPTSILHQAKVLINFYVKPSACISIDDKQYNAGDIWVELNRLWISALGNAAQLSQEKKNDK